MKKHINLFKKIDSYVQLDEKLKRVNYYAILTATGLFVIFVALFAYNYYLSNQIKTLTKQKQLISEELSQKDTPFKINYVSSKTDQVKQYSKNDAHFTTYYNLLSDTLSQNSAPVFTSFKINNKQDVEFGFVINSYDDLQKIMNVVESDSFLGLFKSLKISSAAYNAAGSQSRTSLQFSGVMKHVNSEI